MALIYHDQNCLMGKKNKMIQSITKRIMQRTMSLVKYKFNLDLGSINIGYIISKLKVKNRVALTTWMIDKVWFEY